MRPLRWALINYDLWEEEIWAHMGTEGRLCEDIRRRWPPVSQREKWNTSFSHGLKEESALQTASRIAGKRVSIALATPVCYSLPNCYSPSKLTQLVTYMHTCHYSWAKLLLDLYSDTFSYSFIYSFISSSLDGHLGCFYILVINNVAVKWGHIYIYIFSNLCFGWLPWWSRV